MLRHQLVPREKQLPKDIYEKQTKNPVIIDSTILIKRGLIKFWRSYK